MESESEPGLVNESNDNIRIMIDRLRLMRGLADSLLIRCELVLNERERASRGNVPNNIRASFRSKQEEEESEEDQFLSDDE